MVISNRRMTRLKLGQCERFEQSQWRDGDIPHLTVDTRETAQRFVHVVWSPDDQMIAACSRGGVKVWTLSPKPDLRMYMVDGGQAAFSAFSPDGRLLAAASSNGTLTVWEASSGRHLWSMPAHSQRVATLAFDPTSATIISVGRDGSVKIWNALSGQLACAASVTEQPVGGCAVSGDAHVVALGGKGAITFIDLRTGLQQRCEIPDDVMVTSTAFAGAGTVLVTGASDGIVRLCTLGNDVEVHEFSTVFSSPAEDTTVVIKETDEPLHNNDPNNDNTVRTGPNMIMSLAFGRNDSLLAAGAADGDVAIWDAGFPTLLDATVAHTLHVPSLAFNRDGRLLATCGGLDRIVKIWSVDGRLKELVTLIALGEDQWAAITPDERFDVSSGGLEYLHWTSGTRAVPAKQIPEAPRDPTILPTLGSTQTRSRKPRILPVNLPEPQPSSEVPPAILSPTPVLVVRTRPSHRVRSVAWSHDEKLIAGGTEDGNIDLWDRATERELRTLHGHDDSITSLMFNGLETLVSGARDGKVCIWNIVTGELLHTFTVGLPGCGVSIASLESSGILVCASYDGTIRWLDPDTRTRLHTVRILMEKNGITTLLNEQVIVSPDGHNVVRPYDHNSVAVFDLPSNRLLYEFPSGDTPGAIGFERDSRRFAVGGATSRQRIVLGSGGASAYPPETYAVKVRRTKEKPALESHLGHSGNVVSLEFSPDGSSLATGSMDGTARIWSPDAQKEDRKLETGSDAVWAVAHNRDGSRLATGEGIGNYEGRISIWESDSGERVQTFERHIGDVHPVRFSPDGSLLAAAGEDGILRLWRLRLRMPPTLIKGHRARIFSLAFSPDGRYIATASWDGTSRLWNTETGVLVWQFDSRAGVRVWSLAFNPDGLTLATGCNDGSARIWEISSGNLLFTIENPVPASERAVLALAYAPDGKLLAIGTMNKLIVLWNTETAESRTVLEHDAGVFSLAFNGKATTLVSGDLDQNIYRWDVATGSRGLGLKGHVKPGRVEKGTTVQFTPDDRYIASGGTDGTLRLWDANTGAQLAAIHSHAGPIASVAFNPAGNILAAGSNDASASLWDVRDPKSPAKICNLYSFPDDTWAVVDSVGRFDAANGGDIPWLHWVIGLETVALNQLKERYFEPNLLPKLMGADSELLREVPSLTSVELYPDVELLSEPEGTQANIRLTNRGGGIGRVVVSINGKEVEADARGEVLNPQAPVQEISIDVAEHPFLKSGENICEVRAYNAAGYLVGRQLQWVCQGPKKQTEPPQLWAIVAGISDYQGDLLDLRFAAKDAADVAAAVQVGAAQLFGADKVHLRLLAAPHRPPNKPEANDPQTWPTRQNLLRAFEEARAAKSSDVLLVYLAGHGVNYGGQDGDYYYLTADARSGNLADPAVRQQTSISSGELTEWIRQIPALKQAVILDTCAAGRFVEKLSETRTIPASQARALERMKDRMGTYILAGSTADAVSYESSRYGQGLLTYSVLFGMRGAALRHDEYVDVARLFEHAADYVPQLATGLGGIQRPLIALPRGGSSFDIGLLNRIDRERIPLAITRPLMLPVNLDDDTFQDTLEIMREVNAKLRDESTSLSASIMFIDTREHPDAYSLRGRYRVEGDSVMMELRLFLSKETVKSFEHLGRRSDVETLARELVTKTIGLVVEHFTQQQELVSANRFE